MNTAIFTPARMNQAFVKVRRNSDCAGADGLTPTVYSLALEALTEQTATRPVLVDADIRDFFESVGHSRLQRLIDAWVALL